MMYRVTTCSPSKDEVKKRFADCGPPAFLSEAPHETKGAEQRTKKNAKTLNAPEEVPEIINF